jgi:hypothetical protein
MEGVCILTDVPSPPLTALIHSELVYAKTVPFKGRGVFARRAIPARAVIEHVPALLFPARLIVGGIDNPMMDRFFFIRNQTMFAVPMGFGCIYNHSFDPNADYFDGDGATMTFIALRDIAPDEEITINYNGFPDDQTPPSGFRPV